MQRSRLADAIAGLVAAAVALGVGELVAAVSGGTSPAVAVGDVIVDYTPGPVVKAAIDTLGERDKPVLLAGVVIGALAVGALLGPVAGRHRWVGSAAFAAFGTLGLLAVRRDPLTGTLIAIVIAGLATAAGWLTLRALLAAATDGDDVEPAAQMPGRGIGSRRRFLAFAGGGAGAAALAAVVGRRVIGPAVDVEAQRAEIALPPEPAGNGGSGAAAEADLAVPGLSPLVTPNDDFYRIDTALVVPRVDVSSWRLRVTGMVDAPFELTYDELLAMTGSEHAVTLACVSNEVGGDLVGNAYWRGVSLPALLERAGVQPDATQVVGRSVDGFTVGFPTDVALDGRTSMVAISMNGEPLPARHGFPARLVVPGLYGYVSATKWLEEIELTTLEAFDAYWIPRGWAKRAPIKTQSRIDVPRRDVDAGRVTVAGVAWGGIRGISRIEIAIGPDGDDDAPGEWREATLGPALSRSSWRQWRFDWDAMPGEYRVTVRATDGEGVTQTAERQFPAPDGATGHHSITVRVREA